MVIREPCLPTVYSVLQVLPPRVTVMESESSRSSIQTTSPSVFTYFKAWILGTEDYLLNLVVV